MIIEDVAIAYKDNINNKIDRQKKISSHRPNSQRIDTRPAVLGFGRKESRFQKSAVPFSPYNLPNNELLSVLHHIEPDPASYNAKVSSMSTLKTELKANKFQSTVRFKKGNE
jgi:hypothetical protein